MSPAENTLSVDRKEGRGGKEKDRVNKHYFTKGISEGSMMQMWVKW